MSDPRFSRPPSAQRWGDGAVLAVGGSHEFVRVSFDEPRFVRVDGDVPLGAGVTIEVLIGIGNATTTRTLAGAAIVWGQSVVVRATNGGAAPVAINVWAVPTTTPPP